LPSSPAFAPVGVAPAAISSRPFCHDLTISGDLAQQARLLKRLDLLLVTPALLR